jgi:dTDP-4-dehydrorhamnose reductase
MHILVLGGEGMLGHKMFQTLLTRFPNTGCTIFGSLEDRFYRNIDLFQEGRIIERINAMDLVGLERRLREIKPQVIVNCVGVVKQRQEAQLAIPSISINSLLPHILAGFATEWDGRVIHFSTDCVFSGKTGQYTEEDSSDAEDLYGKSKYLGEVVTENALTLRTSIIGRELSNFKSLLEWFLAQRGRTVRGFTRVIYSGVTTNYLSALVGKIIMDYPALSGLYQVTSPSISKFDLLCLLREAFKLDIEIIRDEQEVSDRSMIGEKFIQATGYAYPKWAELVAGLANDPTPYEKWRGEEDA